MRQLTAALWLLGLGCSGPARPAPSAPDAARFPGGVSVSALPGGNGVLEVTALTLRKGEHNVEVLATLKNVGDVPACHAAFSVELFDAQEQSLAAGITGLLTRQFFRFRDRAGGIGTIAACIAPGARAMAAISELPQELAVEDIGFIVYRCPYTALDVEPIEGLAVERVSALARNVGTAYTGTLINSLDVRVDKPSVTVFALDGVGRPLGYAIGAGDVTVPPGGRWEFETSTMDAAGVESLAYPAGALGPSERL